MPFYLAWLCKKGQCTKNFFWLLTHLSHIFAPHIKNLETYFAILIYFEFWPLWVLWVEFDTSRRLRSFQRGTVGLCRSTGCKVTSCQSWRMFLSSGNRTWAALEWFKAGQMAEFFSNLQLWQLVILMPVDLQRPTVPLWEDLNLLNKHKLNSEE